MIVWIRCVLAARRAVRRDAPARRGRRGARGAHRAARAGRGAALLLGALAIALPFILITFGELEVPSGLTAVLIAPASLFVALFAPLHRPSSEKVAAASARRHVRSGSPGVALLVGVESMHSLGEFLGRARHDRRGGLLRALELRRQALQGPDRGDDVASSRSSSRSVLTLPAAIATAPTDGAGAARGARRCVALGVVGTALAFVIFYKLITEIGAGRASLVSYLAPGIALFYGALLLDEPITAAAIGGLVLILAGVALASRKPQEGCGGGGVCRRRRQSRDVTVFDRRRSRSVRWDRACRS